MQAVNGGGEKDPFYAEIEGKMDRGTSGLPDFPWSKIPKREKFTKLPQNIPNGNKIFPIAVK
jgi:hypothetical protein